MGRTQPHEHQSEIKPFVELESSLQQHSLKPPTQPLRAAHPASVTTQNTHTDGTEHMHTDRSETPPWKNIESPIEHGSCIDSEMGDA